ncbi:unnamed protein product [Pleuronectes platessa]|uniref:Uncharacterized protein n=1 Tax=Pleuronectes platessa TaxID=8262 RepID=A0A9N7YWF3_PLEPL|nr:unnamed protein product [Pleuronectes platessa]
MFQSPGAEQLKALVPIECKRGDREQSAGRERGCRGWRRRRSQVMKGFTGRLSSLFDHFLPERRPRSIMSSTARGGFLSPPRE